MGNGKTEPVKPVVPPKPITSMDKLMNDISADLQVVQKQWQISKDQLGQSREATAVLERQVAILRGQAQAFEASLNKMKAIKTGSPAKNESPNKQPELPADIKRPKGVKYA